MLNKINTTFNIRDLENLSNIKAHTIRAWEKRYQLLTPQRANSNDRIYNIEDLQKLLNVSLLNSKGVKISEIAELKTSKLTSKVKEVALLSNNNTDFYLSRFKVSMMSFDSQLFNSIYFKLMKQFSTKEIFLDYFMPLLKEIGLLWQTGTISPAHEHFMSNQIRQKLLFNIEKLSQDIFSNKEETYVLFLPQGEIHEIGLLFIYQELLACDKKAIYLGPDTPTENLKHLQKIHKKITFVSYITVLPSNDQTENFLYQFDKDILRAGSDKLWLAGRKTQDQNKNTVFKKIKFYNSLTDLVNIL